jgi:hypothetical protein
MPSTIQQTQTLATRIKLSERIFQTGNVAGFTWRIKKGGWMSLIQPPDGIRSRLN